MEQKKIDRINELARKAKEGPLTEAEIASNRESAEGYLHAAEAHRRG